MKRILQATPFAVVFAALLASPESAVAADPTTADCLTANDKAITLRNEHKLLAARTQLLVCAAASCPGDIRKECMRRIEQVNTSIPTVVFEAKDGAGNDLTAVKVKMDGEILTERLEGMAISLDPGSHAFTFETAGQTAITKQLVIREGHKDRREVIQLGASAPGSAAPARVPAIAPSPPPGTPPPTVTSPAPAAESGAGTQKILGIAALGVGVVGVGVGTIFGLQSMSKHKDAEAACPAACAAAKGVELWDDARSAGNLATIGFIIGGAGLVGGTILWLTAKPAGANVQAGLGPGSLQVRGTW